MLSPGRRRPAWAATATRHRPFTPDRPNRWSRSSTAATLHTWEQQPGVTDTPSMTANRNSSTTSTSSTRRPSSPSEANFGPYELTTVMRDGRPRGTKDDDPNPRSGCLFSLKGACTPTSSSTSSKTGSSSALTPAPTTAGPSATRSQRSPACAPGYLSMCGHPDVVRDPRAHGPPRRPHRGRSPPPRPRGSAAHHPPDLRVAPRLPRIATRPAHLDQVARLATIPSLAAPAQIALVRAARAYASGIWIAEEDPNLAWLLLVTAIEVAATHAIVDSTEPAELLAEPGPSCSTHSSLHPTTSERPYRNSSLDRSERRRSSRPSSRPTRQNHPTIVPSSTALTGRA